MKKVTRLFLVLCLLLSATLSQTNGATRKGTNEDGVPVEVIGKAVLTGSDKSSSIEATIDGHYLTVVFLENLGLVQVEISTAMGVYIDVHPVYTPNGLVVYVPYTGNFIVTFTLENGDEYYGEFEVTD